MYYSLTHLPFCILLLFFLSYFCFLFSSPVCIFYPPLFLFILLYCIALCEWLDTSHALCYLKIRLGKEVNEDSLYTKHFPDSIHNTNYSPSLLFQSPLQHSKAGIFHKFLTSDCKIFTHQRELLSSANCWFFFTPSRCLKPSSGFWKMSQIPAHSHAFQLYRWLSRPLRRLKKKHRLRLKLQARWATCNR